MTNSASVRTKFDELKACVIIPTYNNAATLAQIIADVAQYTDHIIVVNDGSTDATEAIVRSFAQVQFISYQDNVGKGWVLRKAFTYATEKGYQFAITIDSDGQHFAKDLPAFIDKLESVPNAIIIGSRNMEQASVPGKSSFGNKFSNFWFKVETGVTSPDTQSGFRAYPLAVLKNIHFFTRKYEFEIEVLVRAVWKGVGIETIPVTVYYAPKEIRVSHFRPFKDFTRISILNTVLVIITFLYIKPRNFFRIIFNKKKSYKAIQEELFNPNESDRIKALSVAFGVFMGIIPIWGFQLIVAIFLAVILRLNKALVIIAANISIPPMIPFIIYLSYKTGGYCLHTSTDIEYSKMLSPRSIENNFAQYIYGSVTLATVAAIAFGVITFGLLKIFKRKPVTVA
ncbi:MAG TPA: DUF2062 domain-containing protein [Ferruginibacter sp.]|jgi:glycosyltransferase involved in cell wall biosynthesis|nr:DUF2062 domain-containing protein [Ferruginibacter sp.]